jgi:glutamate formiminotransferase
VDETRDYNIESVGLIECVPNVSEGRQLEVIDRLAGGLQRVRGIRLLDVSSDPSHNRSVYTMAGDATAIQAAIVVLFEMAIAAVDLRTHRGEHPRIGAVDVVPLIPLEGATMAECVALAGTLGRMVADRFAVPVFLYEAAATCAGRIRLEDIRRGQFEGLGAKLARAEWRPDFGPSAPHPTAGAVAIGARGALIAFNVNLDCDRLDLARRIAARVREHGGGLPAVKALGLRLHHRGLVQVSMNLTNHAATSIGAAFDRVAAEAAREGVAVRDSELVGLIPAAALTGTTPEHLRLRSFSSHQILEVRLRETAGT